MNVVAALGIAGTPCTFASFKRKAQRITSKSTFAEVYDFRNDKIVKIETYNRKSKTETKHIPIIGTMTEYFITILPKDKCYALYLFTDGKINEMEVEKCRLIMRQKNFHFLKVYLYYIGNEQKMDLRYMNLFEGYHQNLFINDRYVGTVAPIHNNININPHYIMKDNNFKLIILNQINCSSVDKTELKTYFNKISSFYYKEYFEDKLTIKNFYENEDVPGCSSYILKHSQNYTKENFEMKMSDIEKLFDESIDTYSLENVKKVKPYVSKDYDDRLLDHKEESLECKYQTHSILNRRNKLACIPVKLHQNKDLFEIKTLKNPFQLLESNKCIKDISEMVEPYTKEYLTIDRLQNLFKKFCSSDDNELEVVYIIFTKSTICIDVQDVIKHNNYVLSELFQNNLPGKSVIWHMVFLYILAMKKCKDIQNILFEEIKMLGFNTRYFISLNSELKPYIAEDLNVCFWYLAHVSHRIFPNDKRNVLRSSDFISGVFLKFYQDVYDKDYTYPGIFCLWKLWYTFCTEDSAIFKILTHYYDYEVLGSESLIILYHETKNFGKNPIKEFEFLSSLDVQTVLNVYKKFIKQKKVNFYEDVNVEKFEEISLYTRDDENQPDLMFHVRINILTCHPYVICPITGNHWKDCIRSRHFNKQKHSYIKLFKMYCKQYQQYPKSSADLVCFLNEYMFKIKNQIPELFPRTIKQRMENVLKIFKDVMETYTCTEYLKCSNDRSSEDFRLKFE